MNGTDGKTCPGATFFHRKFRMDWAWDWSRSSAVSCRWPSPDPWHVPPRVPDFITKFKIRCKRFKIGPCRIHYISMQLTGLVSDLSQCCYARFLSKFQREGFPSSKRVALSLLSVFSRDTNCTWHLTTRLNCDSRGGSFIRILRRQPSVFITLAAITLSFRYNLYVILFIVDVVRHTRRHCSCTYIHTYISSFLRIFIDSPKT